MKLLTFVSLASTLLTAIACGGGTNRCPEGDARRAVLSQNYSALVGMGVGNPSISIKKVKYSSGVCTASYSMNAGGIPVEDEVSWTPE